MRQRRRSLKRVIGLAALALVGFYLGLCAILAYSYVRPVRFHADRPEGLHEVRFEGPGHEIVAWATPGLADGKPSKAVVIFAHGYGGSVGDWADLMQALHAENFDSIALNMRAHGSSEAKTCGFGKGEADELISASEWVRAQGAQRVVVVGLSMGGAAAWIAGERRPELFDGIVSEGAFARLEPATRRWLDKTVPSGSTVLAPVRFLAERQAGIDPRRINPIESAPAWSGKPGVVIHAERDGLIPRSDAEALSKASGAEFWVVPHAHHAHAQQFAFSRYVEWILTVLRSL